MSFAADVAQRHTLDATLQMRLAMERTMRSPPAIGLSKTHEIYAVVCQQVMSDIAGGKIRVASAGQAADVLEGAILDILSWSAHHRWVPDCDFEVTVRFAWDMSGPYQQEMFELRRTCQEHLWGIPVHETSSYVETLFNDKGDLMWWCIVDDGGVWADPGDPGGRVLLHIQEKARV